MLRKITNRFGAHFSANKITVKIISGWYQRDDLVRKVLSERYWLPRQVQQDNCQLFFSL